jgi:hypothetical protein
LCQRFAVAAAQHHVSSFQYSWFRKSIALAQPLVFLDELVEHEGRRRSLARSDRCR